MSQEVVPESGLDVFVSAGRRLLELDPARFQKVLALAWVYIAIYERPPGSPLDVLELCAVISRSSSILA